MASRRHFLQGMFALAVAPALPTVAALPIIYANGVDDDTDGLQALFDRKPFHIEASGVVMTNGESSLINGARFVVNRTLQVTGRQNMVISNCHFLANIEPGNSVLHSRNCRHLEILNNWFDFSGQPFRSAAGIIIDTDRMAAG